MIFVLLFSLIVLLIFNLYYTKFDYIAPNVVFNASFVFSVFMCTLYYKKWDVDLNYETFFIILIGNIIFSTICMLLSKKRKNESENDDKGNYELPEYKFKNLYGILFLILGIITIIMTAVHVTKTVGTDLSHLRTALYTYRDKVEFRGENYSLPFFLNIAAGVMHAGGFWFIALFLTNFKKNKKINWIVLINIILCILSTFLEGSRTMAINYILFAICYGIYLVNYSNKFEKSIGNKTLIKIVLLGIVILASFRLIAVFVGRDNTSSFSTMDYIALYTGAEIKNLDTYIVEDKDNTFQFGKYTFSTLYSTFAPYFDLDSTTSFPFKMVNGYNLGNVYTIFYHFYKDCGFLGVLIFSIFMAAVAQCLYNMAKKCKLKSEYGINLKSIIYCYTFSGIFYSFFSNHFFGLIFYLSFIKYLVMWELMNCFLIKNYKNKTNIF